MLTRRSFLGATAALAADRLVAREAASAAAAPAGPVRLRFGVLSDIHIAGKTAAGNERVRQFAEALTLFRSRGVDAVVIAGDIADWGTVDQLRFAAEAWKKVFPGNRGLGGRPVEPIVIYGNHELDGKNYQANNPDAPSLEFIADDPRGAWKRIFGTPYETLFEKRVKGYSFVCCQWENGHGYFSRDGEIGKFLEARRAQLAGTKPFFYVAHVHPFGTVGEMCAPYDYGGSTGALSKFPNAVAFSGHSHITLTDERMFWQKGFTSVGTASLGYVIAQNGRANSRRTADAPGREAMPALPLGEAQQGLFVSVYDRQVVFERLDLAHGGATIGADWVANVPADGTRVRERRLAAAAVPQFAKDDAAQASWQKGTDRAGHAQEQLVVTFPPVTTKRTGGTRAFDYEVTVEAKVDDVVRPIVRRVFSRGFAATEAHDTAPVVCAVGRAEFPRNALLSVRVAPLDSFGRRGRAIAAPSLRS